MSFYMIFSVSLIEIKKILDIFSLIPNVDVNRVQDLIHELFKMNFIVHLLNGEILPFEVSPEKCKNPT